MDKGLLAENVINELRTAQKAIKRAHRAMFFLEAYNMEDDEIYFVWVVNDYLYELINMVLEDFYAIEKPPTLPIKDLDVGAFRGSFREWILSKLRSYDSTKKNHPK